MAKFINKKEQVWDLELTTYGRYSLSVDGFKPTYYAFYDDNVIYDNQYTNSPLEPQNDIHNRIKNETQYLESLTLFQDVEGTPRAAPDASKVVIKKDVFKLGSAIGDAYLDANADRAPAWKVVALQSKIASSAVKDITNNQNIPQININAVYNKKIISDMDPLELSGDIPGEYIGGDTVADATLHPKQITQMFKDNSAVMLVPDEPLIYVEEVNTQLLTKNFDIEVYEIVTGSVFGDILEKKYFEKKRPQIVNGVMVSATPIRNPTQERGVDSVEYYFDILTDHQIDEAAACKGVDSFNRQSYYVDLDFECKEEAMEQIPYDIYGTTTEPEICQS
jgi:hypothetical protein